MTTPPTPNRFPPTPRKAPVRPPDPYAKIRWLLHATGIFALWASTFGIPLPASFTILGLCELAAFTLQPRTGEGEATDATDVGVRLGCGGLFGLIAVPMAAYFGNWTDSDAGLVVFAIAGAVLCAALALRFGEKFWDFVFRNPSSPF